MLEIWHVKKVTDAKNISSIEVSKGRV